MAAEKHLITAVNYTELSCTSYTAEHMNQYDHKYNIKLTKAEIQANDSQLRCPEPKDSHTQYITSNPGNTTSRLLKAYCIHEL